MKLNTSKILTQVAFFVCVNFNGRDNNKIYQSRCFFFERLSFYMAGELAIPSLFYKISLRNRRVSSSSLLCLHITYHEPKNSRTQKHREKERTKNMKA